MAYIGRQLVRGQNRVLDDISGSFNGSTTAFNLTVSSSSSPPASVNQLWIILGGILQKPGTDFTVADAVLTFTTAPASTLSFWGMIQGDTSDINSPADASVTPSKIANSGDFAFPADVRFNDADGSHYVGLQAPSTVSSNLVWTLPAADGSANQLLKTDGSGALGWATDSATDSTKMPLAGGTFTGDVTFDGATAGRDIVWDRSADNLTFADNAKAVFGTGGDLSVYADGSNSKIVHSGDGGLIIEAAGTDEDITIQATDDVFIKVQGNENAIRCLGDGGVELYYDNVKKVETQSYGIQLHDATAPEMRLFRTGNSGYAKIYADASNKLYICADHTAAAADSKVVIVSDNVERASWDSEYYVKNGSIVFETAGKGVCLGSTTLNAANTLTDYEEGTWTPTVAFGGGSATVANSVCTYTKVGRLVHITGRITLTSYSATSGDFRLESLPFTINDESGDGNNSGIMIWIEDAKTEIQNSIASLVMEGQTYIIFRRSGTTGGGSDVGAYIDTDTKFLFGGTYIANA